LIESDAGSGRSDHFRHELRHVTEAGTQIECTHARADPRRAQQQTRRGLNRPGLRIQTRDFKRSTLL
jgi:hypothetical protein